MWGGYISHYTAWKVCGESAAALAQVVGRAATCSASTGTLSPVRVRLSDLLPGPEYQKKHHRDGIPSLMRPTTKRCGPNYRPESS